MSLDADGPGETRKRKRVPLTAEVGVRRSGFHSFRVRVFDASPEGCKIEFVERPSLGERVWVKFDGLEGIEATVRWLDDHIGGVHFELPLHEAVFQQLVSTASKREA